MVPTPRGLVVLALGISLFAFGWLTRIGWLYLADAMVWGLLLVNFLVPRGMLRGLAATRTIGSPSLRVSTAFEDESITVDLTLENRGLLPKLFVVLRETPPITADPAHESLEFLFDALAPQARAQARYTLQCFRRGVYDFPDLEAWSTAPFGLIRARRSLPASLQVIVYPLALPVDTAPRDGSMPGYVARNSPPRPAGEIRGSRPYQGGDRLRDIHWRNSARHGQLMVKEMDEAPLGEVRFVFNPSLDLGVGRDTTLEYSVKIAASLTKSCLESGRPFRLWASQRESSFPSLRSALDFLARIEPGHAAWAAPVLPGGQPSSTVFALSAADTRMLGVMHDIARRRSGAVALLFEGFAPGEDSNAGDSLARLGVTVIVCRPDGLSEALFHLGSALSEGSRMGTR